MDKDQEGDIKDFTDTQLNTQYSLSQDLNIDKHRAYAQCPTDLQMLVLPAFWFYLFGNRAIQLFIQEEQPQREKLQMKELDPTRMILDDLEYQKLIIAT